MKRYLPLFRNTDDLVICMLRGNQFIENFLTTRCGQTGDEEWLQNFLADVGVKQGKGNCIFLALLRNLEEVVTHDFFLMSRDLCLAASLTLDMYTGWQRFSIRFARIL